MAKKKAGGRKSKYETHVRPRLIEIEGWARDGLVDEQISKNLGVAYSTFRTYKSKFPALMAALKKGKDVVDYEVENALYTRAISGDVTACIFWLKNRKPDKWRDRKETSEIELMRKELEIKLQKLELEKAKLDKEDDSDMIIEVEDVTSED